MLLASSMILGSRCERPAAEASTGAVTSVGVIVPPGVWPSIVALGSGRLGFFEHPAKSSAALATTRQNFFEAIFMEERNESIGSNWGKPPGAARLLQRFLLLDEANF